MKGLSKEISENEAQLTLSLFLLSFIQLLSRNTTRSSGLGLEESNEISSVLGVGDTSEGH